MVAVPKFRFTESSKSIVADMRNLALYANYFDRVYKNYGDAPYREILTLIDNLPELDEKISALEDETLDLLKEFIQPAIRIRNYKAQAPAPESILECSKLLARLQASQARHPLSGSHSKYFDDLLSMEGIQLPTVSAYLHFSHPDLYPIVDRNVESACKLLFEESSKSYSKQGAPKLPASSTSTENKRSKYLRFIEFLSRVCELQIGIFDAHYDYRTLDKALMVLGVPKLRAEAEKQPTF